MKTLLQINASMFADGGQSTQLADGFVAAWRAGNPGATVVVRDLGREPIPHLTAERFGAFLAKAEDRTAGTGGSRAVLRCADRRIAGCGRHRHRLADVQLRGAVDAEVVLRPRRAVGHHVPLHAGRTGRLAVGQGGLCLRDPRRTLRRDAARHADRLRARFPALPRDGATSSSSMRKGSTSTPRASNPRWPKRAATIGRLASPRAMEPLAA